MSQCRPERFSPPLSGYAVPSARWTVPPIFSSNRMFRVKMSMPSLRPNANSPARRAPSSMPIICSRKSCAARGRRLDDLAALEPEPHVVHLAALEDRRVREVDRARRRGPRSAP